MTFSIGGHYTKKFPNLLDIRILLSLTPRVPYYIDLTFLHYSKIHQTDTGRLLAALFLIHMQTKCSL